MLDVARLFPHSLGGVSNSTISSDSTEIGANGRASTGLGAASLATVAPDPAVVNQGEEAAADQISQMNTVQTQWGSNIAGISMQATPAGSTANVVAPVGAAAAHAGTPSNMTIIVVIAIVALAALYLMADGD
jgi:hypothetical protein